MISNISIIITKELSPCTSVESSGSELDLDLSWEQVVKLFSGLVTNQQKN